MGGKGIGMSPEMMEAMNNVDPRDIFKQPDDRPLWERVKELEESEKMLKSNESAVEIHATLFVNYGPGNRQGRPHLVNKEDTAMHMLVKVLTYYDEKIKE